jgi:hypothetical protein
MKLTGTIFQPSDMRVKTNIEEVKLILKSLKQFLIDLN